MSRALRQRRRLRVNATANWEMQGTVDEASGTALGQASGATGSFEVVDLEATAKLTDQKDTAETQIDVDEDNVFVVGDRITATAVDGAVYRGEISAVVDTNSYTVTNDVDGELPVGTRIHKELAQTSAVAYGTAVAGQFDFGWRGSSLLHEATFPIGKVIEVRGYLEFSGARFYDTLQGVIVNG